VAMEARDVLDVLTVLREAQVERLWLDGGWGIDALLGAQHRDHDDLDLVAPIDDLDRIVEALGEVGFTVSEDVRPTRVVLADRAGRKVDLHLVRIDAAGNGWQTGAGPDGTDAKYSAGGFTSGWVGGQTVDCIGPDVQLDHHLGYVPTAVDREDVARLCERFTIPLPDEYK
jgi:lincosamide nucleotidyltransferase A/C/D/E